MNQLPDEIVINILDELYKLENLNKRNLEGFLRGHYSCLEIFVQLTRFLPNRCIFPCLFRNVIIQHGYKDSLNEAYFLQQSDGQCVFRFWLEESVKVLSSDFDNFSLDSVKPYISNIEFHLDREDPDTQFWGNKVEHFLSDAVLKSFFCDIRFEPINKYKHLEKLTLYDPDLITGYGTSSITDLGLYDRDTTKKDTVLELSQKVFPSLKRLEVNSVRIKVLDFNCPLKELRISNESFENYPSIHKLRELKVLTLERKADPRGRRTDREKPPIELPEQFVKEKSESLESLIMNGMKCSSISLDCFPNLKVFRYTDGESIISLESPPETLEALEFYSFIGQNDFGVPNFIELRNLKKLSLYFTGIETVGSLFSECLNLQEVDLSRNLMKKMPDNIEHGNITRLNLGENELTNICNFRFPMLKYLSLSENAGIQIGSLKGCQSLEHLDVSNCELKAIDFITDLPELEVLNAEHNQIPSVQPLMGKTKLKELDLGGNKLTDLTPIKSCLNLRSLIVCANKIKKVDLTDLKYLSKVDVSYNLALKFEDLKVTDSVKALYMQENDMTVLRGNANLRKVEDLDLSSNHIEKVKYINELQSLEELYLESNRISNFIVFEGFKNLRILDLYLSPIESLKGFNNLPNLEWAYFYGSKFKILDGDYLRGMNNLKYLTISNSELIRSKNMTNLPIKQLDLSDNKIEILDEIERLLSLVSLDLSNNRIEKIGDSFGNLPSLRSLNLESNCLKTGSGLEKIKSYTELKVSCDHIDTSSTELSQPNISFEFRGTPSD